MSVHRARAGVKGPISPKLAVALAILLAGCASIDGPPSPVAVSHPETSPAHPMPAQAANPERKRLIDAFGGQYDNPQTESYLNGVLAKLASTSDGSAQAYRVAMLNSPVVNAFALPSGDIFVTRGLLALADDTS